MLTTDHHWPPLPVIVSYCHCSSLVASNMTLKCATFQGQSWTEGNRRYFPLFSIECFGYVTLFPHCRPGINRFNYTFKLTDVKGITNIFIKMHPPYSPDQDNFQTWICSYQSECHVSGTTEIQCLPISQWIKGDVSLWLLRIHWIQLLWFFLYDADILHKCALALMRHAFSLSDNFYHSLALCDTGFAGC